MYGVLFILDDRASACAYYPDADFQTHISVLVPAGGVESPTPGSSDQCSYHASCTGIYWRSHSESNGESRCCRPLPYQFGYGIRWHPAQESNLR